ncbi:hypothetical protein [Hymenobacter coccineus]|uniref:Uncharacterized protein n=1 Tax=Hymenobacter coccineus TaxID=1908235 RepID=A0A1G1TIT3_9BACT|nr:hypothetical protein [Hymenobacter coccineus]OGX90784.1 hypothetical protein BEN49_00355 [Hymenobacter coccineus]
MKKLLFLAALAAGITTAQAQSGPTNHKPVVGDPVTAAPNGPVNAGVKPGQKVNTAPATGANRASRSSSTVKASRQGTATASGLPQAMGKNAAVKPGAKK